MTGEDTPEVESVEISSQDTAPEEPRRRRAPEGEERPARKRPAEGTPARRKKGAPPKRRRRRRKKKKVNKGAIIVTLVILLLVAAAVLALGWAAMQVSKIDTVYPGVETAGVDLSGMTYGQAAQALMFLGQEKYDGLEVTAQLPLDNTLTISAHDAHLSYSTGKMAMEAWNYGRNNGLLGNLAGYVQARYMGRNTFAPTETLEVTLDEDAIRQIVADAAVDINEQLLTSGVEITDTEIRVTKGASGLTLDQETVVQQFKTALLNGDGSGFVYESVPQPDEQFDFQGLYDEIHSEVAEAQIYFATDYDENGQIIPWEPWVTPDRDRHRREKPERVIPELPEGFDFEGERYKITQSQVGVTFDVAAAEAAWAAASYGDTVTVPLTVTYPEMSTEDYENMLFADVLSKNWTMVKIYGRDYADECRTSLAGSTNNRISNVKKACGLLDGLILMPGEIFSYNEAIGQRNEADGWLPAPAYANGEVRQEAGGGICQVSSTLYNAVMYADLEIVERECHQFQVGYLPWGMDATVSWGWPDFKFRNNNEYPIMIHAWVDEETNQCCIQILGTDTEHIYVIIRFSYAERADTTGKYHDANGNALAVGVNAATWRRYYHDGEDFNTTNFFAEVYEFYSQYNYHKEDIEARNVPLPAPAEEG